jgi:hypothetical protein
VRRQGVVPRELERDLVRELRVEALVLVELGQLRQLGLRLLAQLTSFLGQQGGLGVPLSAHRDVLADRHAQRAGYQGGHAGGEHGTRFGGRAGHAGDDPGGRHDAVVGSEHPRAQPVQPRSGGPLVAVRLLVLGEQRLGVGLVHVSIVHRPVPRCHPRAGSPNRPSEGG